MLSVTFPKISIYAGIMENGSFSIVNQVRNVKNDEINAVKILNK